MCWCHKGHSRLQRFRSVLNKSITVERLPCLVDRLRCVSRCRCRWFDSHNSVVSSRVLVCCVVFKRLANSSSFPVRFRHKPKNRTPTPCGVSNKIGAQQTVILCDDILIHHILHYYILHIYIYILYNI